MKKIIGFLLILSLLISNISLAWWNCSWLSMTPLSITNTGTAQSNYVVEIRFTSSTVSNYIWSNLDKDLRFIDSDGVTILKHFSMPRSSTTQEVLAWVSIPSVPVGTKTIYMYYNNSSASSVSNPSGVLVSGIRMYTKQASTGTTLANYTGWWNTFNSATAGVSGYGCSIKTNITNVSNNNTFGSSSNILFSFVTVLTANSSGTWNVRHGPDYGFGGGLYSNDIALQEKYGTDLWWGSSWANTAQLLQGSFSATSASYYVIRSLGGEGSADGPEQIQIASPSGVYFAMDTSNFTLNAPPCEAPTVNKVIGSPVINAPTVTKTVAPFSDPINGTTNPKLFPGGRARYTITVTSTGPGIDLNSINLLDGIPTNTKMYVGDLGATGSGPVIFTDGTPTSSLTYSKTNLTYSNNNGSTYTYTPIADSQTSDSNITNIKINPQGTFACSVNTPFPNFSIKFDVIVK